MGLQHAKSDLVSTQGGLLSWLRPSTYETPKETRVARRSILRKPTASSPRKQQCFYVSPNTGGPVESVYRYVVPSPLSYRNNPTIDEMDTSEDHTDCSSPSVKEGSSESNEPESPSESATMRRGPQARGATDLPPIGAVLHADLPVRPRNRSLSPLSSDSDSEVVARRKWQSRTTRHHVATRKPITRASPLKPAPLPSFRRAASPNPQPRVIKRSSSDGVLASSLRLDDSLRRISHRQRASQDQIFDRLAKLQLESEDEEAWEREQARLAAEAERKRKEEAEWARRAYRIVPSKRVIASLSEEWERKLADAMDTPPARPLATAPDGTTLTRRDFGTLYPQSNANDNSSGWLNDEIINTSMQHIIAYALEQTDHKRGTTPKFHSFASQFYSNLSTKGPQSVARWGRRAKIGGADLLNVEYVFIPVNSGSHWTLLVAMPTRKLVEYFDSYHGTPDGYLELVQSWLEMELASGFVEDEWTFRAGISPSQSNAKDCGVFLVTTAKMIMLGLDPEKAYCEADLNLQRKRIACELINGGFSGDFEPRQCGKPGVTKSSRSRRGSSVGLKPAAP